MTQEKKNTKTGTDIPPFPRLGEIYRVLALALDTKDKNKDSPSLYRNIDRLAREGEYDWSLLPTLCQELVTKPLERYIDADFAQQIEQFASYVHQSYLNLVAHVSLDSLNREEALPLLVENYFAAHGDDLLLRIQKEFGGPDILLLLDAEKNPIEVVLDWASDFSTDPAVKSLVKMAFATTTGTDKANRDTANRWIVGTQLPDIGSINRFVNELKVKDFTQYKNLRRWLVVARALAWLEEKSPIPLRNIMRQHLLQGIQTVDIKVLLADASRREGQKRLELAMPGRLLHHNLMRTTPKLPGDKAKTKADLETLERLTKQYDTEGRTQFHIEWLNGRWHVLSGELEQALSFYERAAQLVNYRGGESQKAITQEALVIAGYLGDKTFLKQLKNRAIAFGLFSVPLANDVVEKWEVTQFRQQFHSVFPVEGRFPEVDPAKFDDPELPFLTLDKETIDSMEANLRSPNQVRKIQSPADGQIRRWSQLRLFSSFGRLNEVAELLERGADVNKLDESNGSALLCAIQYAENTGERAVLDLLLKQPHAKETLNKATDKKRLTPLLCAIDYGEPDVVAHLLEMGADADRRGHVDQLTPLYHCMGRMALLNSPKKFYDHILKTLTSSPDMVQRETMRRYNVSFAGVFGDADFSEVLKDTANQELFSNVVRIMAKEHMERHSDEKLLQIVQLLLKHGANPNVPHSYPVPGRTPLMLAAENNSVPVMAAMLKHRGDPYIKDAAGNNCMKIAMSFRSHAVINYLRVQGIR